MQRTVFIAFLGILVGLGPPVMAQPSSATWYCSALLGKSAKKPSAFKFKMQGTELIDFEVSLNAFFKKWELKEGHEETRYKIVEDTPDALIAVHYYGIDKESGVSAVIVLIDKVSNEFRQIFIATKSPEPEINYEGTCLLEK
jgi:hypothetical protein